MIRNYLLTAYRNILRHKGFSIINIIGLAISMSVCMLIIVIIIDQFRYDKFVTKADRIYRIESIDNESKYSMRNFASTAYPLFTELTTKYAVVEDAVVLNSNLNGTAIYNETRIPISGFYASSSFFKLFEFTLSDDSEKEPLTEPYSIILQEETAKKYFKDENPMGKFLQIDSLGEFKVTGIIKDNGYKSQFQFKALVSASTLPLLENTKKIKNKTTNWENCYSNYIYILRDKNPIYQK